MQKSSKEGYIFILPSLLTLVAIVIFPTLFLWYVSLTNYDLSMGWEQKSFVGLRNFSFLFFEDKDFWYSLRISLLFMGVTVSLEFVLGLGVALLFHRHLRGKRVWMSLLMLPMVITPTIISLIWKLMLNTEYGVLNFIISQLGLGKVNWLGVREVFWSLILGMCGNGCRL